MSHDCPAPECDRSFDSQRGLTVHRRAAHDYEGETAVCEVCGDEYYPSPNSAGKYCSPACYHESRRAQVILTCEVCGEEFGANPAEAERRKHCSKACSTEAKRRRVSLTCAECGETFETTEARAENRRFCSNECKHENHRERVTLTCNECGEPFDVWPCHADTKQFCSHQCRGRSQRQYERRTCASCGRGFSINENRPNRHCSTTCEGESRTSKPRPDDVDMLLWVLYVYEEHNWRETWLRANGNLPDDDRLTQEEVRERLRANGWTRGGHYAKYESLTLDDVGLGPDQNQDQSETDATWQKYSARASANGGDD